MSNGVSLEGEEFLARMLARAQNPTPEDMAREAKNQAEQEARRMESERQKLEAAMRDSQAPARSVRIVLSGEARDTRAMAAVRAFMASESSALVLAGGKGCGKSTAAVWAIAERRAGHFRYAGELAGLSRDDDERRKITRAPLLVIDDLGVEYLDDKGWFAAFFDEVIVRRHDNELKTIITTNLPKAKFSARYRSERVLDRLSTGMFVEIPEGSMRGAT